MAPLTNVFNTHTESFAVISRSRPPTPPKQQLAEVFGVSILLSPSQNTGSQAQLGLKPWYEPVGLHVLQSGYQGEQFDKIGIVKQHERFLLTEG